MLKGSAKAVPRSSPTADAARTAVVARLLPYCVPPRRNALRAKTDAHLSRGDKVYRRFPIVTLVHHPIGLCVIRRTYLLVRR